MREMGGEGVDVIRQGEWRDARMTCQWWSAFEAASQ